MTESYAPLALGGGWRAWWALTIQLAATVALVSLLPAFMVWQAWTEAQAVRRAWSVHGPPCAVAREPASPAASGSTTFRYGGAAFTRRSAAASCAMVPDRWWSAQGRYPACAFDDPGAVTVFAADEAVTFQPPPGQPVVVTVRHGQPTCVVGSRAGG